MKFGSEMNSRSIERWSNYNINYNLIKQKIKLATTEPLSVTSTRHGTSSGTLEMHSSSSSTQPESQRRQQRHQKRRLKQLYGTFKDQIGFVSLFVNSKYGEISRRILTTKKRLNVFINDDIQNYEGDLYTRMRTRRFLAIHRELETISRDLQDLSRFVMLQKVAVRKLFKKFLKYSTYEYKDEFIGKINNECLSGKPDSFVNLNMSDAAMELTLLFDVMNNYYDQGLTARTALVPSNTQSLGHTPFLPSSMGSSIGSSGSFGGSGALMNSKVGNFEAMSRKQAPITQIFWVHKDNLDEIRFFLLREFKLITDDTGIVDEDQTSLNQPQQPLCAVGTSTSEEATVPPRNFQLKKTESSLNLARKYSQSDLQKPFFDPEETLQPDETFQPDTRVVTYWLANLDNPRLSVTRASGAGVTEFADMEARGEIYPCDTFPQITINDSPSLTKPFLVAPVGGLRQFTFTPVGSELLVEEFYGKKKLEPAELVSKWQKSGMVGSPNMAQLTFSWCQEKNVRPVAKMRYDRMRFLDVSKSGDKSHVECYITLDSNIRTEKLLEMDTTFTKYWPDTEAEAADAFPHSVLCIRYDSPLKRLSQKVQALVQSHLVFRVDTLNFTINNYLFAKYCSDSLSDHMMMTYVAPWFGQLQKNIRKLPSLRPQTQPESILLNKEDVVPPKRTKPAPKSHKEGYWNEFDYGSDFEEDPAFYVYADNNQDGPAGAANEEYNMYGLNLLTPEKIESILGFANKVSGLFHWRRNDREESPDLERQQLLPVGHRRSYRSLSSTSSNNLSDSDTDFFNSRHQRDWKKRRTSTVEEAVGRNAGRRTSMDYRPNELAVQITHDKVLTCLYFSLILISYLVNGAGMGIVYSVINSFNQHPGAIDNNGVIMLLLFGFLCMSVALILSIGSICLIMCRYSNAPQWHFFVVWLSFFLITAVFIVCLATFF